MQDFLMCPNAKAPSFNCTICLSMLRIMMDNGKVEFLMDSVDWSMMMDPSIKGVFATGQLNVEMLFSLNKMVHSTKDASKETRLMDMAF